MTGTLPQTAKYALRAAAWLGSRPAGERYSADAIAEATNVPPAFLRKVLRQLVEADLLSSEKGHHGGFALSRPAEVVRFLDVVEAIHMDLFDPNCVFGWGSCDHRQPCPLHASFLELKQAVIHWAASHTLADADWSMLR